MSQVHSSRFAKALPTLHTQTYRARAQSKSESSNSVFSASIGPAKPGRLVACLGDADGPTCNTLHAHPHGCRRIQRNGPTRRLDPSATKPTDATHISSRLDRPPRECSLYVPMSLSFALSMLPLNAPKRQGHSKTQTPNTALTGRPRFKRWGRSA